MMLVGLGITPVAAPLTSAVLRSVPQDQAGIGSAVNNAAARIASLVMIALAGVVLGGGMSLTGFHRAVVVMAVLLVAGAVISALGIQNPSRREATSRT